MRYTGWGKGCILNDVVICNVFFVIKIQLHQKVWNILYLNRLGTNITSFQKVMYAMSVIIISLLKSKGNFWNNHISDP